MPFPRGQLVRHELYRYFIRRHGGKLDPRPSMLEHNARITDSRSRLGRPIRFARNASRSRFFLRVCWALWMRWFTRRRPCSNPYRRGCVFWSRGD